jgi:perosamine synthetase
VASWLRCASVVDFDFLPETHRLSLGQIHLLKEDVMRSNPLSRRKFLARTTVAGITSAGFLHKGTPAAAAAVNPQGAGKPAILGGTPIRSEPFPSWPVIDKVDEEGFLNSLRKKEWCRLYGKTTTNFEEKWAGLLGAKYATGVVNGTNAIYAALYALDVGPGDEVIVPSFTFVATVNAVIQQFALPVFIDTDIDTFQMDVKKLDSLITENTRCILPVHMGGNVANMDVIKKVSAERRIPVVEDACQAHFAEWRGKRVGSIGDIGCFSFQASKILPCGEGGAIVTSREDLLNRFHAFQNNGRDRLTGTRNGYQYQGTNLRMTEFQAALLLAQLTRFDEQSQKREANAHYLIELFSKLPGIQPAKLYEGCTRNTYYLFMARYDARQFAGLSRSKFLRALNREGIPCGAGYDRLNEEPFLEKTFNSRAYKRIYSQERLKRYREMNKCPANDQLGQEGLFFSQNCLMGSRRDVEQVVEAIGRIQKYAPEIAKG